MSYAYYQQMGDKNVASSKMWIVFSSPSWSAEINFLDQQLLQNNEQVSQKVIQKLDYTNQCDNLFSEGECEEDK